MPRYDDEDDEPRRRRRPRDDEDDDDDRPRRRARAGGASAGVTAVGVLTMVLGVLVTLLSCGCAVGGVLFAGGGVAAGQAINQQPQAQNVGNVFAAIGAFGAAVMFVGALFLFLIGVAYLWSGYGVLQRQGWARVCTLILAALTGLYGLLSLLAGVFNLLIREPRPPVAASVLNIVIAVLFIGYAVISYVLLLTGPASEEFA